MFTLTIGTDTAVAYCLVFIAAVFTEGDRLDLLKLELCIFDERILYFEIIPSVNEVIGNDAGYFPNFQSYGADLGQIAFLRQFIKSFGNVGNNT